MNDPEPVRKHRGKMIWSVFLVLGVLLLMLAGVLPVDRIVSRAIPPHIVQLLMERGQPERIIELREQFGQGLQWFRLALALLGAWCLVLPVFLAAWKRSEAPPAAVGEVGDTTRGRDIWMPIACAVLMTAIAFPMLGKGFEHSEFMNFEMLAQRGPIVTAACQNVPPRAAQPAYTVIESMVIRVFGESERAARLPALLFAAAGLIPFFFLARHYGGRRFAAVCTLALLLNGFYLFYGTYARGYALSTAAYIGCLAVAFKLRTKSTPMTWALLGVLIVITAYAHLTAGIYIAFLGIVMAIDILVRAKRSGLAAGEAARCLYPAIVVFGSAALLLFVMYAVGVPTELAYMRAFNLEAYYMSYHLNARFLQVMLDLWALVRETPAVAWAGAILAVVGLVRALRVNTVATLYVIVPALGSLAMIGSRGLFVYPRFFTHFLPGYVLCVMLGAWFLLSWGGKRKQIALVIMAVMLAATAVPSMVRLYRMERCGVRAAVELVEETMQPEDRVLGVLDGFDTVRYYYPKVESAKRGHEFWAAIESDDPPEYIVSVPYIEYDISGATKAIEAKYVLMKTFPSWLDVDDNQDSVLLYRRKDRAPVGVE